MTNDKPPQALAATPAVGGEVLKLIPRILERADSYISDNGRDDAYSCNLINDLASILRRVAALPASPLRFEYTNWRGETADRRVSPISIRYGTSEYHKRAGWLMLALDLDKNEQREFAMCDMTLVGPVDTIDLAASPPEQPAAVTGPDNTLRAYSVEQLQFELAIRATWKSPAAPEPELPAARPMGQS